MWPVALNTGSQWAMKVHKVSFMKMHRFSSIYPLIQGIANPQMIYNTIQGIWYL